MKKILPLVLLGVLVIVGFWGCNKSNAFIKLDQDIKEKIAGIESNFTRRNDLYKSAIEAIQSSGKFERNTLAEVIEARSKATSVRIDANDPKSLENFKQAQAQLSGSFSRLIATSEAYPTLKTTDMFVKLQDEIVGTENRFKKSRDDFSETIKKYNNAILIFPSSIVASIKGLKEKQMFEASAEEKVRPNLNIDTK